MTVRTALVAVALLAPVPALAEATAAQRAACTPDVWRLCAAQIPDVPGIKACLRRERARLSPGCRVVMDADGDAGRETRTARADAKPAAARD